MLVFGVIGVCVMLLLLAWVLKAGQAEHYNVLYGGREFEVYLSSEFRGRMCEVSVYEVIHPDRKFFRTKYRHFQTFWIDDFATIKEGIYHSIECYLKCEKEENLIEVKWNEVKENV